MTVTGDEARSYMPYHLGEPIEVRSGPGGSAIEGRITSMMCSGGMGTRTATIEMVLESVSMEFLAGRWLNKKFTIVEVDESDNIVDPDGSEDDNMSNTIQRNNGHLETGYRQYVQFTVRDGDGLVLEEGTEDVVDKTSNQYFAEKVLAHEDANIQLWFHIWYREELPSDDE